MHALGILRQPVEAVAYHVQAPVTMAAQSVLAAASLGAQAIANVLTPYDQVHPLSLYFLTIASSGERKTACDRKASGGIEMRQKEWSEWYHSQIVNNKANIAAWHAAKKRIEFDRTLIMSIKALRIGDLGPEPNPLPKPILTPTDMTVEGLSVNWGELPASLGLFTSEAGIFTQGAAMTEDMKVRTAGALCQFWDGTRVIGFGSAPE